MLYDQCACPGGDCPLRKQCLRYRAVILGRQDFFGAPPFDPRTGQCGSFSDLAALDPTDEQIRDRAYRRWLSEGRPEGRADSHWHAARAELVRARDERLAPESERP